MKMFFARSSKSAFSSHGNVQTSLTLLIWLNENVPYSVAAALFLLVFQSMYRRTSWCSPKAFMLLL